MAIIITSLEVGGDEDGVVVKNYPDWCIIKSQFCPDQDDDTFVTIGLGGGTEITKAQLKTRALELHTRYPFLKVAPGGPPMTTENKTNAEVETMVDDWCTERNAS